MTPRVEGVSSKWDDNPWYMKIWWGVQIAALLSVIVLSPVLFCLVGAAWAVVAWSSKRGN